MNKPTETLYRKMGRKYVPVASSAQYDHDHMKAGTFRLVYAYGDGGHRYEYEVTPATAPMVAGMMIARVAMEDAIREASKMRPSTPLPYTKKQRAAIERFRADMGGMFPTWWTENSAYEISDAAMRAVLEFRP